MNDKTEGEAPEVVAYQWLDTAHYRKKLPFECVSQQWHPLMTVTQHQRIVEGLNAVIGRKNRRIHDFANEVITLQSELEEAEQDCRNYLHEVEQLKAQLAKKVVLPECLSYSEGTRGYVNGWNACLDEVQRLNGAKPCS